MVRESDIIHVDDSSDHSSDGDAPSMVGLRNDSTSQASPENHMPPPPNQPSGLANALDSHE